MLWKTQAKEENGYLPGFLHCDNRTDGSSLPYKGWFLAEPRFYGLPDTIHIGAGEAAIKRV